MKHDERCQWARWHESRERLAPEGFSLAVKLSRPTK